jgi:ankyrin repeat protein
MRRFGVRFTKRGPIHLAGGLKRINQPYLHMEVSRVRPKTETIETLLASGEDVNGRNEIRATPLLLAASCGHVKIVELLLSSGAEINAVDVNGQTALILAAAGAHKEVLDLLLDAVGVDMNCSTTKGMTALMYLASAGDVGRAGRVIAAGADPQQTNHYGQSAITIAVNRKDEKMLALLRRDKPPPTPLR